MLVIQFQDGTINEEIRNKAKAINVLEHIGLLNRQLSEHMARKDEKM